jgi:BirA family biotin operon repressor/biotin-[acetyl-CoA-carboxylase] ligase
MEWIDRLRKARKNKVIGREIWSYPRTDSTNLRVRELAAEGADEGLVVIAESQSAGKGRLGRTWESPGGVNLYFSVLLRPAISPPAAAQIPLLAGVAVARGVSAAAGVDARLKWPNDILLNGKKIAGILSEMELEGPEIRCVILGVGINVNWKQEDFTPELQNSAGSISTETGKEVDRAAIAAAVFEELEAEYSRFLKEGFSPRLREEWNRLSWINHKRVTAVWRNEILEGRALGLDQDGALLVEGQGGEIHRFLAGDVSLRL